MTERRSVLRRAAQPRRILLQARDQELIYACYDYEGLTRSQIQRLFGIPTITRINSRLRALFDSGFLQRLQVPTPNGGSVIVYLPGEAAIPLLAVRTERSDAEIRRAVRASAHTSLLLRGHDLELAALRVSITLALRADPRLRLGTWRNTRDCFHRFSEEHTLRPDGFFQVWCGETVSNAFVEYDRGSVDLARWQAKVRRYLAYADGPFTERYGLQRFRVAVTVPDPARLEQLLHATRLVANRRFWFALSPELTAHGDLTRPIWRSLNDEALRPFINPEE